MPNVESNVRYDMPTNRPTAKPRGRGNDDAFLFSASGEERDIISQALNRTRPSIPFYKRPSENEAAALAELRVHTSLSWVNFLAIVAESVKEGRLHQVLDWALATPTIDFEILTAIVSFVRHVRFSDEKKQAAFRRDTWMMTSQAETAAVAAKVFGEWLSRALWREDVYSAFKMYLEDEERKEVERETR